MVSMLLFIAGIFLSTFVLGKLLEKIYIPWLFSGILIGLLLAATGWFRDALHAESFTFLADLGMLFLLFIIGFELNVKTFIKKKSALFEGSLAIILAETVAVGILIHSLFAMNWTQSLLVAASFATVAEAMLPPILDEFGLTKKKLGQTILGIGIIDDIVELITILLAIILLSRFAGHSHASIGTTLLILLGCASIVYGTMRYRGKLPRFAFKDVPSLFLFVLFFIFLFAGVGGMIEAAALGAILAGISLRNLIPDENWKTMDNEIRTISYGFLAPLFFVHVGANVDFNYITGAWGAIVLLIAFSALAKIGSTWLVTRKELGWRGSVTAGIGLSVKLSTSVVVLKLLLDQGVIDPRAYSLLIIASIVFTLGVPVVLGLLLPRWKKYLV